jgi:hypothetical protein
LVVLHSCACYFGELVRRFPHPRVVPLSLSPFFLYRESARDLFTHRDTHTPTHTFTATYKTAKQKERGRRDRVSLFTILYIYISIFFCIPKSYVYKTKRVFFKERNSGARGEGRKKRAPNDLSNTLLFTCGSTHTLAPPHQSRRLLFLFSLFSHLSLTPGREKNKRRGREEKKGACLT